MSNQQKFRYVVGWLEAIHYVILGLPAAILFSLIIWRMLRSAYTDVGASFALLMASVISLVFAKGLELRCIPRYGRWRPRWYWRAYDRARILCAPSNADRFGEKC